MRPSSRRALRWTRSRLSRWASLSGPWLPRRSVPVNPMITVMGVRSSCETAARNRSFKAEARWSSRAVPGDPAALLLEKLVLLGEPAGLFGQPLVGRGVGEGHREARGDRAERVPGAVGEGPHGAQTEHADGLAEVHQGHVQAFAGEDAAVEEVDRRRLRVDGHVDRPLLAHGAAGLLAARRPGPLGAADRNGRREVTLSVGDVEDRARGSRDLDDLVQHPGPEAREVVDGCRRGEHGVDGRLDVAGLEGLAPLEEEARGRVVVEAELADFVVGRVREPRSRAAQRQIFEGPRCRHAGCEDAPVEIGEEQEEADEDQRREDDEGRRRGIPGAPELKLPEGLAAGEVASRARRAPPGERPPPAAPGCRGPRGFPRGAGPLGLGWSARPPRSTRSPPPPPGGACPRSPRSGTGAGWLPSEVFSSVRLA